MSEIGYDAVASVEYEFRVRDAAGQLRVVAQPHGQAGARRDAERVAAAAEQGAEGGVAEGGCDGPGGRAQALGADEGDAQ